MPMLTPSTFALDFIGEGAEHPVLRPFTVSEAQKKELAAVVAAVWAKIQALDFTPL
jgi:hypothetical protein